MTSQVARRVIAPQPGRQQLFLASSADIAIYGGAAGGGKSYALLLEGLRHSGNAGFRAIYFRRTSPELRAPGGLWDTSRGLYSLVGGRARDAQLEWTFRSGARIKFSHLEHDSDRFAHQGAQYALICFDEVNHFSEQVFWYLLSRNRSTCGVRPYVRATCNPDPDSWVAGFIAWWLDAATGIAIPERVGVLRWFTRVNNELVWADSRAACVAAAIERGMEADLAEHSVLSATFVAASLADNPALLEADPGYKAKLAALSFVDRQRLLEGNWRIREAAGLLFRAEWFSGDNLLDYAPSHVRRVRFWDLAASKKRRSDHTAGVLLSIDDQGLYCVEDVIDLHSRPHATEETIRQTAIADGIGTEVWLEQEHGSNGDFLVDHIQRNVLQGFSVSGLNVHKIGSKLERAKPVSSVAEKRFVRLVRGEWNRQFLDQLQAFPDGAHDDQVDGFTGAFYALQDSFVFATART